jgi:NDP-4-keto-2,6-dideoxyhexose 3-C-methyltransferase
MDTVTAVDNPCKVAAKKITCCRVCSSEKLEVFWDGGEMRIVEFPLLGERPSKPIVPLQLAVCSNCHLVQLMHSTDPAYLYEEFWYRSGTNEMMRRELAGITAAAVAEGDLKEGDWVLDIGCNDGTMLNFYPESLNRVGIDPAKNINPADRKRKWQFFCGYFSDRIASYASHLQKYKAVTAIAMFYDLEDPVEFCRQVKNILHDDGVFIVQMNYLPLMLRNCTVDNASHEHLTYFSLHTLMQVFEAAGLKVYRVQTNETNGGSIRVFAQHNGMVSPPMDVMLRCEREQGLHSMKPYEAFSNRVKDLCRTLDGWLERLLKDGRRVYAYGASTRGTTLLQLLHTEGKLIACAERDERKIGRYMVGANLPIVTEEQFRKEAQYGLVLPYHFLPAILKRESDWLDAGGKFIVPLPHPNIIEWNPWGAH